MFSVQNFVVSHRVNVTRLNQLSSNSQGGVFDNPEEEAF